MGLSRRLTLLAVIVAFCIAKNDKDKDIFRNHVSKEYIAVDASQIKEGQQVYVIKPVSEEKDEKKEIDTKKVAEAIQLLADTKKKFGRSFGNTLDMKLPPKMMKEIMNMVEDKKKKPEEKKKKPPPKLKDFKRRGFGKVMECDENRAWTIAEEAKADPEPEKTHHCPDNVKGDSRNKWEFVEGLGCFFFDGGDKGCKGSWSQSVNFCKHLAGPAGNSRLIEIYEGATSEEKSAKDLYNYIKKYAVNKQPFDKRNTTFSNSMAYYRKYISTQESRTLRKEPMVQMLPERQTRDSGPWLGGNDIAAEGQWIWDQAQEHFQDTDLFTRFIKDDVGTMPGNYPGEDCLELFSSDGTVNDMNCDFWRLNPLCHIPYSYVEHKECPDGWDIIKPFGCYFHHTTVMTWPDAKKHCTVFHKGAFLAEPQTKEAMMAISQRYGQPNPMPNMTASRHSRPSGPWLGATDAKAEGQWIWATSKKPVLQEQLPHPSISWADDEGPSYGEDCMEVYNDKGLINDMNCTYWQLSYLCELPFMLVPGPQTTPVPTPTTPTPTPTAPATTADGRKV